jgi:5'-deoxynucleotidase YfbR-like HD superfamily hydrolase
MEDLAPLETSQEMFSLWQEFENGNCLEADIARQLDKLEMIIQADEYERQQGVQLQDFFDSTATAFSHPEVPYLPPLVVIYVADVCPCL